MRRGGVPGRFVAPQRLVKTRYALLAPNPPCSQLVEPRSLRTIRMAYETTQAFKPLWDKFGDLPSISWGAVGKNEWDNTRLEKIVR
jgi:hypothetical protein